MTNCISGLVVTLNEERNIARCIKSLWLVCNEVIVIDSGSQDRTTSIAQSLGAKIIIQSWVGHGPQRNLGLTYCSNKWVFSLDADEETSKDLAKAINLHFVQEPKKITAYAIPRKNFIGPIWVRHSGWHPDVVTRLFDKTHHQFTDSLVHEKVGTIKHQTVPVLEGWINHYSYDNVDQLRQRAEIYALTSAIDLASSKKNLTVASPLIHGVSGFIKKFLIQKGVLNGKIGLAIARARFHNAYLKYKTALEIRRNQGEKNR